MAHYWTQTHPELSLEDDVTTLLRQHEELGRLLLDPTDVERSQLTTRLYGELESLRAEHDDRRLLREALAQNEEARKHQQLLIHELNHRVKNTLAIIQSIAMQTLRGDNIPPDVRDGFVSRLIALADAHDILTHENWEAAEIGDLLGQAVRMYQPDGSRTRITFAGPSIRLLPKAAVALAMAAHELATNAAKYGALSNETGRVDVRWGIDESREKRTFQFRWSEHEGPLVQPQRKTGFGTRLIERGLAGELSGSARLQYLSAGLICEIEAPLATLEVLT